MEHLQGKTDKTCSVTRLAPVYVFQKLARVSFCSRTLPCLLRKITFRSVCILVLDPISARTALLKLFLVNLRWLGVTFAVGAPALCFSQLTESRQRDQYMCFANEAIFPPLFAIASRAGVVFAFKCPFMLSLARDRPPDIHQC